jgi:hypothetical protein
MKNDDNSDDGEMRLSDDDNYNDDNSDDNDDVSVLTQGSACTTVSHRTTVGPFHDQTTSKEMRTSLFNPWSTFHD